jgi:hypothetical protein
MLSPRDDAPCFVRRVGGVSRHPSPYDDSKGPGSLAKRFRARVLMSILDGGALARVAEMADALA